MPVINDDKDTLMIRCSCHSHILEINNDNEWIDECIEPDFNISVWNQTPCPTSFWERIKIIWLLICGKRIDGGDVIITNSDAMVIANFLTKKVDENKIRLEEEKQKQGK